MSGDVLAVKLSGSDPWIEWELLVSALFCSRLALRKEHREVVADGHKVLLVILDAVLQPGDEGGLKSGAFEVQFKIGHAVDLILQPVEKVHSLLAKERSMPFGKNRGGRTEVLNSRGVVGRTSVGVGEHRKNIRPILTEDLSKVGVAVNLLCSVVFMEVLSPSPTVNVRGAWNRRDDSVKRVRSESVRIVKEHNELEHRSLVVAQVDEGSISNLSSDVGRVNAVISAGVIDISSEELGMRSAAIKDIAQKLE
jgi:hypothetical protein